MRIVILDAHTVWPDDLPMGDIPQLGEVTAYDSTRDDEILARCQEADIVLTNKVPLTGETLSRLPRLRLVCVMATGVNNIDLDAARRLGITVKNIPAYSTASVAQMVFAHLLTMTNRVEHYTQEIATGAHSEGDFCFWDTPLMELAGKTLAIVGLGRIGKAVARIALSFDMHVIALTSQRQEALPAGIEKVDKTTLFQRADILSLHCPLTPETENLVCRATLQEMKPTAFLINTSRGPVVNEHDVAESLQAGRLAAYGADVASKEPVGADNPLLHAPNVFLTPHIAWATREARSRLVATLQENIKSFLLVNSQDNSEKRAGQPQ